MATNPYDQFSDAVAADPYDNISDKATTDSSGTTTVAPVTVTAARKAPPMLEQHDHGLADKAGAVGFGALDGATLGAFPYAAAAVHMLGGQKFGDALSHEKALAAERFAANPASYGAGEVGGTVASMLVPGLDFATAGRAAALGARAIPRIGENLAFQAAANAAGRGAGAGAVRGLTAAPTIQAIPGSMAQGATIGGITGGALHGAGTVLPMAGNLANNVMDNTLNKGGRGLVGLLTRNAAADATQAPAAMAQTMTDIPTQNAPAIRSAIQRIFDKPETPWYGNQNTWAGRAEAAAGSALFGHPLAPLLAEGTSRLGAWGTYGAGKALQQIPANQFGALGSLVNVANNVPPDPNQPY